MINWNNADQGDKILLRALSLLYSRNENFLHMHINPDMPRLITFIDNIKNNSLALSSGEQLLIRIGLDIWDGEAGGINFNELYQKLDLAHF